MWKCKLTAEWNTEEFVFLILSSIPVFPPRVLSALGTVNYTCVRADCKKRERKAAQRSWTSNSLQRFKKRQPESVTQTLVYRNSRCRQMNYFLLIFTDAVYVYVGRSFFS